MAAGTSERLARGLLFRQWLLWHRCEVAVGDRVHRSRIFDAWKFDLPLYYRRAADFVANAFKGSCLAEYWTPSAVDDLGLIELVGNHWNVGPTAGPLQLQIGSGPLALVPLH